MELHGGSLGGLSCSTGINVSKVDAPQPADDYPKRQSRPTFQAPPLTQPRVGLPHASGHRRPPTLRQQRGVNGRNSGSPVARRGRPAVFARATPERQGLPAAALRHRSADSHPQEGRAIPG